MKRLLLLVSLLAFSTLALAATTVDLNSATQAQIAALPKVGSTRAKAIVDYRTANGCFKSVSDLLKVKGMTQANIDAIDGLAVVGTCPSGGPPAPAKAQT
jgi:competence protein ComEA